MLELALVIAMLALFDWAAWLWGVDSREGMSDTHSGSRYRGITRGH